MLPCRLRMRRCVAPGNRMPDHDRINNLILTHWSRSHPSMLVGCELLPTRYDELAEALKSLGCYAESGSSADRLHRMVLFILYRLLADHCIPGGKPVPREAREDVVRSFCAGQ